MNETIPQQCRGCVYRDRASSCCNYALLEGHTRSGLHLDDLAHLNDPCKERKAGKRKRNSKAASILPPRPKKPKKPKKEECI